MSAEDLVIPPTQSEDVTPHATNALGFPARALWIGTGGDLTYKLRGDSAAHTLKNVPSGTMIPGFFSHVVDTSTADDIVAFL